MLYLIKCLNIYLNIFHLLLYYKMVANCEQKCIFICVFNNEVYLKMLYLLLESLYLFGNLDNNTNILIYTHTEFMQKIIKSGFYNDKIIFEINDKICVLEKVDDPPHEYNSDYHNYITQLKYKKVHEAAVSRLDLFSFDNIQQFKKILYLDTDVIINGDINEVFDVCQKQLLYVVQEGTLKASDFFINNDAWGKTLFSNDEIKEHIHKTAFSSGVMLFENCDVIKDLFYKIRQDLLKRPHYFHDQPHFVYNAFIYNLYDNQALNSLSINDCTNYQSKHNIHHFPGLSTVLNASKECEKKIVRMEKFLLDIKKYKHIYKHKLLWVSDDYRSKTGYGRVARELFPFLKNKFDIFNFAIGCQGSSNEYNIINSDDGTGFGFNKLPNIVDKIKPDIIILLNDSAIISAWLEVLEKSNHKSEIIPYLCTEYIGITPRDIQLYNKHTRQIITMATFTIDELCRMGYKYKTNRLPHGYTANIKKMDKKKAKQLLGINPDTFVFFSGNKNQPRKRLDIIIRAFVVFLKENPDQDVLLMMNCGLIDTGYNLNLLYNRLCKQFEIKNPEKYIYFCSKNIMDANKSDDELTVIYNASDVGITTSTGESFGLVPFEQSSLGIPQIVPKWGGIDESIQYGAIKIEPNDFYVYPVILQSAGGEAVTISYLHVKEGMEKYFKDKDLYKTHSEAALNNCKNHEWIKISEEFCKIIDLIVY